MYEEQISFYKIFEKTFERVNYLLFKPFDIIKWLIFGFGAFLSSLGRSNYFNFSFRNFNFDDINKTDLKEAFFTTFPLFLVTIIGIFFIILAIFLIFLWLSSRGTFIFIHQLSKNSPEIIKPFKEYSHLADSLFFFRLFMILISFFLFLTLLIIFSFCFGFSLIFENPFNKLPMIIIIFISLLLAFLFFLIDGLLFDFVAPLMLKRDEKVLKTFSLFLKELFFPNFQYFLLFYLLKIGLIFGSTFLICLVTCFSCCMTCIPYISSVILLPISSFFRIFSLTFLSEFGKEYDIFAEEGAEEQ